MPSSSAYHINCIRISEQLERCKGQILTTLASLTDAPTKGDRLKKLKGHDLYSARLNNHARLVFERQGDCLILLAIYDTHDEYERALKHRNLKSQLRHAKGLNEEVLQAEPSYELLEEEPLDDGDAALFMDALDGLATAEPTPVDVILQRGIIIGDEQRISFGHANLLTGPPGCGKT